MEEKKTYFWDKLLKTKKGQVFFFFGSMLVIVLVYLAMLAMVEREVQTELVENLSIVKDEQILFSVDKFDKNEKHIEFSGWIFRLGTRNTNVHLVLNEVGTETFVLTSTELYERNDVGEFFAPEWNFGNVGYTSEIKESKLEDGTCYEVQFVLSYEKEVEGKDGLVEKEYSRKISSGYYLYDGELYEYNPLEFYAPEVSDAELVEVISEGTLRAYDIQEKIWIYQYGSMLYLITDPAFGSLKASNVKVPVMPATSRVELLPENRMEAGFDHLGAYYEDAIYMRDGVLPYQVVKVELNDQYPIIRITTGLYNVVESEWWNKFIISVADWSFSQAQ